ncbi:MAG: VacB/RNase II family 3'-5' exoribonuclease, partial [Clostridia bacterium]|nr:VacB/RNase II family 3'-5' exoribonuclease [Clostridia bacterium]
MKHSKKFKNKKTAAPKHRRRPADHKPGKQGKEREETGLFFATRQGFGFVTVEGMDEDIFIPASHTGGALHGDKVEIRVRSLPGGRTEGRVTAIKEAEDRLYTGVLYAHHGRGKGSRGNSLYVMPDDKHLPEVLPLLGGGADVGDKIAFSVLRGRYPAAEFYRSFGPAYTREANYESILTQNGIEVEFDPEAEKEAERQSRLPLSVEGRRRVKGPVFTIDGADAKDLDDAVSLEKTENGWLLGVHIADVAHYVRPKTALDRAVMRRGTSVYFTDKVVPMLPKALSNGACSLHPGADKLTLSAYLTLDEKGAIKETHIEETVLQSDVRGVYSEVNDLFEKEESSEFYEKYKAVYPALLAMRRLYGVLLQKAKARGYMELESAEAKILLDERGEPTQVIPRERGDAERIIEHFMLTANEGVATFLSTNGCPCVYRVHDTPPADKLSVFLRYVYNLGFSITEFAEEPLTSLPFCHVLEEAAKNGTAAAISFPMLRAMSKAEYTDKRRGHFGLGLTHYCHFTSPIRRLSDLATHRMIKQVLWEGKTPASLASYARRAAAAAT